MQCRECKHVSQDVSPIFCSHCGVRFATSAAQGPVVDTKPSLTPEMELGSVGQANIDAPRELRADVPLTPKEVQVHTPHASRPMGTSPKSAGLSIPVPSQSCCPTAQTQKKKKKRKRKKKFHFEQAESESLKSINSSEEVSMDFDSLRENPSIHLVSEAVSLIYKENLGGDRQNVNVGNEHGEMGEKTIPEPVMYNNSLSDPAKTDPTSPVEQLILLNPTIPLVLGSARSVLMDGDNSMKELSAVLLTEFSTDEKRKGAGDQSSLLDQKEREHPVCKSTAGSNLAPLPVGKVADGKETQKQNCSPEYIPSTEVVEKEKTLECVQIVSITENVASSETSGANATPDTANVTDVLQAGEEMNKGKTGSKVDHVNVSETNAGLEKGSQLHTTKEKEIHPEIGKEKGSPPPDHKEEKKTPIDLINKDATNLDTSTNPGNAKSAQKDTGKPKTQPSTGKGNGKVLQTGTGNVHQGDLSNERGETSTTIKESGGNGNNQEHSRRKNLGKENAEKKGAQPKSEKGAEDQESSEKTCGEKMKNQVSQESPRDLEMPIDVRGHQEGANSSPVKSQPNKNQREGYLRSMNPEDLIHVYFHVIISSDFKLDLNKHKVVIRGDRIPGFNWWKDNICEMNYSKDLDVHGMLFEGLLTVPKEHMKRAIPYKYCVLRGKNEEYEFIYKPDVQVGTIVNRCLYIPSEYIKAGEWHQYDDIACVKQDKKWFDRWKSWVGIDATKKSVFEGKKIAGKIMLERLLSILIPLNSVSLNCFLTQLHHFCIVARGQMVDENGPKQWTALQFGQEEVNELVLNSLRNVAEPFLKPNNTSTMLENALIKDSIMAGLLCLIVGHRYKLVFSEDQLSNLCKLLCLEMMPRENAINRLRLAKEVFSAPISMKEFLKNLCHQCIDLKVQQWIWILPVLHFFSSTFDIEQSPSNSAHLHQEDIWAGLEGFTFHDVRKYAVEKKLLNTMKSKLYLLDLDRTLVRSWFCLLPLENLVEFLNQVQMNAVDALAGTCYKLMEDLISYTNHKNVEELLEKLLQIISFPEKRTCLLDAQEFCLFTILKMYDTICKKTNGLRFFNIPALSVCIIFKIPRRVFKEVDLSCSEVQEKLKMVKVYEEALKITKKWFTKIFSKGLPKYIEQDLKLELQVWNQFVNTNFDDEQLADVWKNSLLGDLEGRIKQTTSIHTGKQKRKS